MAEALAGTIGLARVGGDVGRGIRIGQWLNGDGFENYEHAFVYLGDGTVLEAEPGGARIAPLSEYPAETLHWCSGIRKIVGPWNDSSTDTVVAAAAKYVGTPYSFLDYDALAVKRLHLWAPGLKRYIASTGHMICSQLCDQFYRAEFGVEIFNDGRWPGYVTPGSLYERDQRLETPKTI